ncbi:DUF945 family protein [Vreelandella sp. EE22]
MAVSSKALGITAGAVIVVGVGGYLGVQAAVGTEAEKSLVQAFDRLDRSPSWHVLDVRIDRSLFNTTATATLGMSGHEDATADIDLFIDHGVIRSPVTGTIQPNEAFFVGVIGIDMVASMSGVEGQLTADTLRSAEVEGELTGLVMDVAFTDEHLWHIDTRVDEVTFNDPENEATVRVFSPRFEMDTRGEDGGNVHQRMEIPRIEILAQGMSLYMDATEMESITEPADARRVIDQTGHVRVAEFGVDDTSMGSLSMDVTANNWHIDAFQTYQEAYAPLIVMQNRFEEDEGSVDEARYRELMTQAIENGHAFLVESPSAAIQPLSAHIVLPELELDFKPRLTAQIRFDGEGLSKEALYSAFWNNDLAPRTTQDAEAAMSPAQANAYLLDRLYMEVDMTTPPPALLMQLPLLVSLVLDTSLEQQTLTWDQGRLTLNGEELM